MKPKKNIKLKNKNWQSISSVAGGGRVWKQVLVMLGEKHFRDSCTGGFEPHWQDLLEHKIYGQREERAGRAQMSLKILPHLMRPFPRGSSSSSWSTLSVCPQVHHA